MPGGDSARRDPSDADPFGSWQGQQPTFPKDENEPEPTGPFAESAREVGLRWRKLGRDGPHGWRKPPESASAPETSGAAQPGVHRLVTKDGRVATQQPDGNYVVTGGGGQWELLPSHQIEGPDSGFNQPLKIPSSKKGFKVGKVYNHPKHGPMEWNGKELDGTKFRKEQP